MDLQCNFMVTFHLKRDMSDLQWYQFRFYLINNVENIVVFLTSAKKNGSHFVEKQLRLINFKREIDGYQMLF